MAPVMPPPGGPSSTTTTDRPSAARRYAVVSPAIPAPTTHTSARTFERSAGSFGGSNPSHQTGSFFGSTGFVMTPIECSGCATAARRNALAARGLQIRKTRRDLRSQAYAGRFARPGEAEGASLTPEKSSEPARRRFGHGTRRPDARLPRTIRPHRADRRRRLRRRVQGMGRADESRRGDQGLHAGIGDAPDGSFARPSSPGGSATPTSPRSTRAASRATRPFIVQELLGGEDLSALIARREPVLLASEARHPSRPGGSARLRAPGGRDPSRPQARQRSRAARRIGQADGLRDREGPGIRHEPDQERDRRRVDGIHVARADLRGPGRRAQRHLRSRRSGVRAPELSEAVSQRQSLPAPRDDRQGGSRTP